MVFRRDVEPSFPAVTVEPFQQAEPAFFPGYRRKNVVERMRVDEALYELFDSAQQREIVGGKPPAADDFIRGERLERETELAGSFPETRAVKEFEKAQLEMVRAEREDAVNGRADRLEIVEWKPDDEIKMRVDIL